uniref:Coatomer subunit beta n=1 Tax=Blastobotrys adeninivorans TaxID=409370 RepID=A0A060T5N3_BLAAD
MNLLEKGRDEVKIEAMQRILVAIINGDPMPQLLMHIIRFVMPSKNKQLKKLLHFYWEVCPKLGPDGKLKQEMILVCNAIRNDLQHPNEYIRGATLRFLNKLREPDLLEPLVPSVRACLDHRHAYVRKNAVFAVYSIAQTSEHLIPDAADLVQAFLVAETDSTCKRNAFVALQALSRDDAFAYLQQNYAMIGSLDELLQLAFLEFIRRDGVHHPELRADYLSLVETVLETSDSSTVIYEAASTLTGLSGDPAVVRNAALRFVELATKESDNNIKLIVLERVDSLRIKNPGVLEDLTMSILYVLSSPDLDVRRKALDIALSMVSGKNVDDVVKLLKKELTKTVHGSTSSASGTGDDKSKEYRQMLIHAIHTCAIRFTEVAASVVDLLLDFLGEFNSASAVDVIAFVKEVAETYPELRDRILKRLISALKGVHGSTVYRDALWVLGEYCTTEDEIQETWVHIRKAIGEMPILATEQKKDEKDDEKDDDQDKDDQPAKEKHKGPKILADGTYASETAFSTTAKAASALGDDTRPPLRALILNGSYFIGGVLANTVTKLALRYSRLATNESHKNALRAEALLIMTSILRVGQSDIVPSKIDEDSADRIFLCIRTLVEGNQKIEDAFLEDSRAAYRDIVETKQRKKAKASADEKLRNATQVDTPIKFRQLARVEGDNSATDELEEDLAIAASAGGDGSDSITSRLQRIVQLTGFSDPVYAEAYVMVHQFDIVLDVLLFNQTSETLQNLSVEFATLGDLKVVERPTTQNVGPQSFHSVQTTIKVSSADAGVIFGNIVYEGHSASVNNIVILNDVHIDIMDYIKPGDCSESDFRTMWTEFEWENKVNISVTWKSLKGFLMYLLKNTNMTCLTQGALSSSDEDECQFLSANLHARSSFGEDALANLSIEKDSNGKITGHVRIRSKGQGLALSLGDRFAELQRNPKPIV